MKFRAYTYDLFGNDEDGYEVNDLYSQGYIELHRVEESNEALLEELRECGYRLSRKAEVQGEYEHTLYIEDPAFKPVLELRRVL